MHTYIDISSSLKRLTNVVTQPVSISRIKLWKVVFNFWTLLLKTYLSEVAAFFVAFHLSSQLNFVSGISNIKDSCS